VSRCKYQRERSRCQPLASAHNESTVHVEHMHQGQSKATGACGQGRDRAVDLPIFRRKVKPVISPVNRGFSRLAVKN